MISVALISLFVAQDYMKMMKPYEETPQDMAVVRQLVALDQAQGTQNSEQVAAELTKLRAMKPSKNLQALMKSKDPMRRALTVMGLRMLPVKRVWEDLRYMLMDSDPQVRRQVMIYAQTLPQGIEVEALQMSLADSEPMVRQAAIGAILKTSKRKANSKELFKSRLEQEKDPNVVRTLKSALMVLDD